MGFIVHMGDDKTAGGAVSTIPETQQQIWLVDGCQLPFLSEKQASLHAIGSLADASAHWYISVPCMAYRYVHKDVNLSA